MFIETNYKIYYGLKYYDMKIMPSPSKGLTKIKIIIVMHLISFYFNLFMYQY